MMEKLSGLGQLQSTSRSQFALFLKSIHPILIRSSVSNFSLDSAKYQSVYNFVHANKRPQNRQFLLVSVVAIFYPSHLRLQLSTSAHYTYYEISSAIMKNGVWSRETSSISLTEIYFEKKQWDSIPVTSYICTQSTAWRYWYEPL